MTGAESADQVTRREALDPNRSFIVQAPAGSGKTELLIQRYLALIASVREPEQIVAITFTRKAAAEMRGRIIEVLRAAADDEPVHFPHRVRTQALAKRVLDRDRARGWSLLSQTQRIRVDTLDALNAWLAQQLPILAGGIAGARISESPSRVYAEAARRTIDHFSAATALGSALRSLLEIVGNSLWRLERLLAALLPTRDQWLPLLRPAAEADLRSSLDRALGALARRHVEALEASIPPGVRAEILELVPAARAFIEVDRRGADTAVPRAATASLAAWREIAAVLLTKQGQWRSRFTKEQGFGPERRAQRKRLEQLLESLRDDERIRLTLVDVQSIPDPEYGGEQWHDLAALRRTALHLVAELRVLFAEYQVVDFIELALAAQQALGAIDEPSELLLALDQRIEHILVDEFQDTSHSQYRLLELLTAGWTPGDGRSLFLVGDPMQSIYRFRDADMSLFLKVKEQGLGNVRCGHLVLRSNFRSSPAIVDWVNRTFASIFPDDDSPTAGVARYHACVANRESRPGQGVFLHALVSEDGQSELDRVVAILGEELLEAPAQSIGILVQSRRHLIGLQGRLRARGWPVHAIEIESLAETQIGQDLIGLTRAMTHLGDRIAWLAVLRAPWCGLTWEDLERLCAAADELTIWQLLRDEERLARLSADGRARVEQLRTKLDAAFRIRGGSRFSRWIERCWRILDGPASLPTAEDGRRARLFFSLLGDASNAGDLDDPAALEEAFRQPRAQGETPREQGIELMTIHRAKGLEFDTVVVLGLGRKVRDPEPKALRWSGGAEALIAPMPRRNNRLDDYLNGIERRLDTAERSRLLYVATTRARERLHLVTQLDPKRSRPPRGSLLSCMWAELGEDFRGACVRVGTPRKNAPEHTPQLWRLNLGAGMRSGLATSLVAGPPADPAPRPVYEWVEQTATHVGTLVHKELQFIADNRLLDEFEPDRDRSRYVRELELLGVPPSELDEAAASVALAVRGTLADPRGRWILGTTKGARSELEIGVRGPRGIEHLRLDRTFVDEAGVRWIVDFKTSRHEGGGLEAFLANEVERYRLQLERYAAALARLDSSPIRVGLYFPLLTAFREWQPELPEGL